MAYVIKDIKPYKSMITGEIISSRSQHREHLKRHNCFEIGNEIDYAIKTARSAPVNDRAARIDAIKQAIESNRSSR